MDHTPSSLGSRYRIHSPSERWKKEFGYARQQAMLGNLKGLGSSWVNHFHVEIWEPANLRGDIAPNMIFDITGDEIIVWDLGGHDGMLMQKLNLLVDTWRKRYMEPELCMIRVQEE